MLRLDLWAKKIQIWDLDELDPSVPITTLKVHDRPNTKHLKDLGASGIRDINSAVECLESGHSYCQDMLVSGSTDGTVRIWNITKQSCDTTIRNHGGKVSVAALNPQSTSILFSGSYDRSIVMMDTRLPQLSTAFWKATSEVEAGLWNPHDPTTLFISTNDGLVSLIDTRKIKTREPLFEINAHEKASTNLAVNSFNPGILASYGMDRTIKFWNISHYYFFIMASFNLERGICVSLEFCSSHPYIIAAGDNMGSVSILDLSRFSQFNMLLGQPKNKE